MCSRKGNDMNKEERLRTIQSWQRIMLRIREHEADPESSRMSNNEWEYLHQDLLEAQYEEAKANRMNTGIYKIRCHGCRRVFYTMVSSKKYCWYNTCGLKEYRLKQRVRRLQNRSDTVCHECGKKFTPQRSDAKYCSSACRQKSYRGRVAGSQNGNLPQP